MVAAAAAAETRWQRNKRMSFFIFLFAADAIRSSLAGQVPSAATTAAAAALESINQEE